MVSGGTYLRAVSPVRSHAFWWNAPAHECSAAGVTGAERESAPVGTAVVHAVQASQPSAKVSSQGGQDLHQARRGHALLVYIGPTTGRKGLGPTSGVTGHRQS